MAESADPMPPSIPPPAVNTSFPRRWQAEILPARPAILPARHFVYPRDAEEVERGALEVLVRPEGEAPFLATGALGFRDPAAPTGVWSCPHPDELCLVSGGYAYIVNTRAPERAAMLELRPVLEVRPLPGQGLVLFAGHHSILAWGASGQAWHSGRLSDEGISITGVEGATLTGTGWLLMTDEETSFRLDLTTGSRAR